jgi:transposase
MIQFNAYFGLDVHQDSISIGRALPGEEAKYLETIENNDDKIRSFFRKELEKYPIIQTAYEAGGCGYHIHRLLCELGIHSQVIAPTHIPKISGKRVKNDKIDACNLTTFLKNEQLTAIYIPTQEDEVVREKTRQREVLKKASKVAKQQVLGLLRRHGIRFTLGKTNWTKLFWNWLGGIHFADTEMQFIFLDYVSQVEQLRDKVKKLDDEISKMRDTWSKKKIAEGLSSLKSIDTLSSTSIVAEVGSFSRFQSASEFMAFIGLTPSEYSSGKKVTRGSITKTGNNRIRRLLVEATKHYRKHPRKSNELLKRWELVPLEMQEHAWKAQRRLYRQYWKYLEQGKHHNVATIAVARELAGFIWALGCMAEKALEKKLRKVA